MSRLLCVVQPLRPLRLMRPMRPMRPMRSSLSRAAMAAGLCLALAPLVGVAQTRVVEAVNSMFQAPPAPVVPALAPPPPEGQAEGLGALLARVLPRDPQVRVAVSLAQAAEQRRLQARSRLGPSVYLSATQGGAQESEFLKPIDRTTSRAEAGLRWNLYNAGNDMAELNGATRDIAAAAQDLRRAREEVAERLAETYADLLRLQNLLPHAAERLAAVRKLVDQVRQQNDAGRASDADATQAAASLLDAEIVHEQLLADLDSARRKLAAQVGGEVRLVQAVDLPAMMDAGPVSGTSGLLASSQLRADAARDRVRPVVSLLAPRIDLEYRQQLHDGTTPEPTTLQKQVWQITARWEFPVLGESAARRTEAQRRAEAVQADAERVAQVMQAELQTLGPRISSAERSLLQLEKQAVQYNQLVRAGELQFEAGRRSVTQLIGLRDSRYSVEQRRSEQAHRLLGAKLRLLALTGRLLPALGLGGGAE